MGKTKDSACTLNEQCASARRTIRDLRTHMEGFVRAFSEDGECWRGDAASEEQGFVGSDKIYLDELLGNMEAALDDRDS